MYPLFLDLDGRRVVVVGGGCVAARRARGAQSVEWRPSANPAPPSVAPCQTSS